MSGERKHLMNIKKTSEHTKQHNNTCPNKPVLRSRSRWSRNNLGPGAGAEIKFFINIFCSQFGRCYDEDKLISNSISILLLF